MRNLLFVLMMTTSPAFAAEGMLESEPGVELYWRTLGEGSSTLIVPGGFLFDDALDALAKTRRLVLYDMRNRGRSSRVTDPALLTIDADVRDLEAVRRHFSADRFSTIGYSYLGKMVILYALEHPQRVDRIVQIGPVAMRFASALPPMYDKSGEEVMDRAALAELRALRERGLHESNPQEYCEREWLVTRVRLVGDPAKAGTLKSKCALPNEWPTRLVFHFEHHFTSARERNVDAIDIAGLNVPVLTVHGTRDRNAPYGGGREWAAFLPSARLLTVEGAAHQAWADDDRVMPAIAQFLDGRWPERSQKLDIASEGALSQLRAHELLGRALESHGGAITRATSLRFKGASYLRSQSMRSSPPFDSFPTVDEVIVDGSGRMSVSHELHWPNFVQKMRKVADEDAELRLRVLRRMPASLIAAALKQPASLRLLGVASHSIVAAEVEGSNLTLWFDAQSRLRRIVRTISDELTGDTIEDTQLDGVSRFRTFLNGVLSADTTLESTQPAGESEIAVAFAPSAADAAPAAPALSIERLADRVWLISNIGGRDYRSLVVERDDGLLLGEAPFDAASVRAVIELLASRFPAKKVSTVVVTHHHFDHSGGVVPFMRAGAKIVTTPGNAEFFRQIAKAPRTLAAESPVGTITLDLVSGQKLVLDGAGPRVEVHRIHAPTHAEEMLFIWLPKERIVFQGDLFRHDSATPERARPQSRALLERVESAKLDVDRIVGVHGAIATARDLRDALR